MVCQASEVWFHVTFFTRIISRNPEMNIHFKWKSLGRQEELNSWTQLKFFQETNSNSLDSWLNVRIKCFNSWLICVLWCLWYTFPPCIFEKVTFLIWSMKLLSPYYARYHVGCRITMMDKKVFVLELIHWSGLLLNNFTNFR